MWSSPPAQLETVEETVLSDHFSSDVDGRGKDPSERAFLFVAVLSSQGNEALRYAARRTWLKLGHKSDKPVVHRFFVGSLGVSGDRRAALEQEAALNRDLVLLENVPDAYSGRTYKVLQAFVWVVANFWSRYVLKLNDDSFARLDAIVSELMLKEKASKTREDPPLYWGFFAGHAPVARTGPWAEPAWYLSDRYLPYACGGGYVLSWAPVQYLHYSWERLQLYANDDVSVGVWLAPWHLNSTHDRRFDTENESRGCFNSYLVTHKQTKSMMEDKYQSLEQDGVLCREEVQFRMSYVYDREARPSQCCIRNISDISLPRQSDRGL
ncbi:hypothetical protein V5799_007722 [Amblyomma americanum]|uniref:Hexosyltransferase n=1 Tax=Amblyomma americanum TaxID=6943 RepID=A0AAQ4FF66_AMBAM